MFPLLVSLASAASLDTLEVGGLYGTPAGTGALASWWNPAGLASEGTQLHVEMAPTWGGMSFERAAPNPGTARWSGGSVIPTVGLSAGAERPMKPGVGLLIAVPYATGGREQERGVGSYATREGSLVNAYALLGAGVEPIEGLRLGAVVAGVRSSMSATVDMDTVPDLHSELIAMGEESPYTDRDLEDPRYAATSQLAVAGTGLTGGLGAQLSRGRVEAGLAFQKGLVVDMDGGGEIQFGCPPVDDAIGRFGAESKGLCHTRASLGASSTMVLPHRVHAGLAWYTKRAARVELFGAWVGWSAKQELALEIRDLEGPVDPQTAALIEGSRPMAQGLRNSGYVGLDAKRGVGGDWVLGGRAVADLHAVPTHMLSPSNADTDTLRLSAMLGWKPRPGLELDLSFTHHVSASRTNADSAFGVSLDRPRPEAYASPHGNGTYRWNQERLGLALRWTR